MAMILSRKFILYALLIAFMIFPILIAGYYLNEIRNARLHTEFLVSNVISKYGKKLKVSDLSPGRKAMLLAVEDPTFFTHHGVDLCTPGAGMTTITQGLVKLLYYPEGFKQGIAKIRQTLIAQYVLDSLVSKDEQLNLFLNISYLGNVEGSAIHGFEDAAQIYFSKNFTSISNDEYLMLVGMLISPNLLKPYTQKSMERLERIKKYLSGEYKPAGVLDFNYNGRRRGSLAEEALMMFLRLVTNACPD